MPETGPMWGVTSEAFALNSPLVAAVNEGTSSEYGFVAAEGVKLARGASRGQRTVEV